MTLDLVDVKGLLTLFTFAKKAELQRYARDLVINPADLTGLILAADAGDFPLRHASRFVQREPPHLHPTPEDLRALSKNGVGLLKPEARKTMRKVFQMFEDRRLLAGHLFYTLHEEKIHEWHLLSFDQRDEQAPPRKNHWVGGPHVHFVNWLWPNLNGETVWKGFVETGARPKGLHIRKDPGYTEEEERADREARAKAAWPRRPAN